MARQHGTLSNGMTLGFAAAEVGPFTLVGQIQQSAPPGKSVEKVDKTTFDSDDDYKEFMAGMREGSECTGQLLYKSSIQDALDAEVGEEQYWQITFRDGATVTWFGFLMNLSAPQAAGGAALVTNFTIACSGKPTWAPAGS